MLLKIHGTSILLSKSCWVEAAPDGSDWGEMGLLSVFRVILPSFHAPVYKEHVRMQNQQRRNLTTALCRYSDMRRSVESLWNHLCPFVRACIELRAAIDDDPRTSMKLLAALPRTANIEKTKTE